ncbi:MAG: CoA pyrophosphatase [Vicinamibacterales bacterium]
MTLSPFDTLVARLTVRLGSELPGPSAQRVMAPVPRTPWPTDLSPEAARQAAALLLLYPVDGTTCLALTRRASHLTRHGGQISFPGGVIEPEETVEGSALREAQEEVGVDPTTIRVIGRLTPLHIFVSGFVVHPVVAAAAVRPQFAPDRYEVERILDVPLPVLMDPATVRLRRKQGETRHLEVPYFLIDGETVWGATAMMLAEFLTVLGHPPFRPSGPTDYD